MAPYAYAPLQGNRTIRLLVLHQGYPTTALTCSFEEYALDTYSSSAFEALSYCWGTDPNTSYMTVLEHGRVHQIEVRPNLEAALTHLRCIDRPRKLWVDALCINQKDDDEKNSQVLIMASIYSCAKTVCVWLGDQGENSPLAFQFIRRILSLVDLDRLVQDITSVQHWAALLDLIRRPWFSRRWIVQEITLAKRATVHCGDDAMGWTDFADAVVLFGSRIVDIARLLRESVAFRNHADFLGDVRALAACRLVDLTYNVFRRSGEGGIVDQLHTLETLVVMDLPSFNASNTHDIIYAALSLAKDTYGTGELNEISSASDDSTTTGDHFISAIQKWQESTSGFVAVRKRFPVDYSKSYFDVFRDFVGFAIQQSGSLDIICRPWSPTSAGLPSWILPLSSSPFNVRGDKHYTRINADPLVGPPVTGKRIYSAARATLASVAFSGIAGDTSMFVDGFVLDSVKAKESPAEEGNIPPEWLEFGGWVENSGLPPDSIWRTLIADRDLAGLNPPHYWQRACEYAFALRPPGGTLNTEKLILGGTSILVEYLRRVQSVVWRRRLIRTDRIGALGLAPRATKKGDLICILYGCSVPVILRLNSEDQGVVGSPVQSSFQFIGECYIHGMMDGEAFEVGETKQTFKLL